VAKLAGGLAALGLLVAGVAYVWVERSPVRQADVEAFLDRSRGAGRIHFSVDRLVTLRREEGGAQVAVVATGTATEPLFTATGTSGYLARTFGAAPRSPADAQRILLGRMRAGEAGALPGNPYQATILEAKSRAGAVFDFQGIVDVKHGGGQPALSLVSGGFVGTGPQGEPRSAFSGPTFVAGDPQDDSRLRALLADVESAAAQEARASPAPRPGPPPGAEGLRGALLGELAVGRIFQGLATEAGLEQGATLYLEIVEVSQDGGVRALLRNEGGWELAREFRGHVGAAGGVDAATLALVSHPNQAVRGGGPILEDAQTWSLALRWNPPGGLSGESRHYEFTFQPLGAPEAAEAVSRLRGEYDGAVEATAPGALYVGSATSVASGASEPVLLRFIGREGRGAALIARMESANQAWKRGLRGSILANSRRSGGEPILLLADGAGAAQDAPADSALGWHDDLEIRLSADRGSLAGRDGHFTYRLAVAKDADLHRLETDRAERLARLAALFRPGVAFDGTFREEQGFTTHARLEVDSVDRETGAVSAHIGSRSLLNVRREFQGVFDPSGSALVLEATARGSFHADEDFDVPFLKTGAPATLRLSPSGNSIAGKIEGDPTWTIDFPVGIFLSAPVEPEGLAPAAGDARPYPEFPKAGGAYLLREGAWVALPRNQGHFVDQTIKPNADLHLSLNVLDLLGQGIGLVTREKEKKVVTFFQFDGKDPRPVSRGGAVTVLFVGPAPAGKPAVELALGELQKDGSRRVLKAGGPADVLRFGETRVAAYVRQVSPGCVMLTSTSGLEAGPYAFNADTGYELTRE
jgi:hypothetical protein